MLLRHATPRRNLSSIRRMGLLTALARGKTPAVWLHSPGRSAWAALHTVKRHGGRVESVVVLEVSIPRSWLRRCRKGVWQVRRDIGPERLRGLIDFGTLAGPSADAASGRPALALAG